MSNEDGLLGYGNGTLNFIRTGRNHKRPGEEIVVWSPPVSRDIVPITETTIRQDPIVELRW